MSTPTRSIKARPTVYNGIQMRSRLEATTAAALDRLQIDWQYEPGAFGTTTGQYLPDFYIRLEKEPARLYLEVRPTISHVLEPAARETEILWSSCSTPLLYVGWAIAPLMGIYYEKGRGVFTRPSMRDMRVIDRILGETFLLDRISSEAWLSGHATARGLRGWQESHR